MSTRPSAAATRLLAERLVVALANRQRRRFTDIDYVMFSVPPQMPALPEPRNIIQQRVLGEPPLSLLELERTFARIGRDARLSGVILYLRGLGMSLADLQTLRDAMTRLRRTGKRVIVHAHNYDTLSYYVASAADEIVLLTGGELAATGLVSGVTFMRDALDTLGVGVDVVAISPFKNAMDSFTQRDPTPETQAQIDWLLDSNFQQIVDGIATGRNIAPDDARVLIDGAPYTDEEALTHGYVDAVLPEEGLAAHLRAKYLVPWAEALKVLPLAWPQPEDKYVAVLPLSGLMVEGESQHTPVDLPIPILGEGRMGSMTVVEQVRALMKDPHAAAVILFIDSGGGSSTASEAMAAALDELAQDRPLIVCMNGVAASGGYYLATPARWIVAQPGTITGSIGVFQAKLLNGDLVRKLRFNAVEFLRGANASYASSLHAFTPEQRERVQATVDRIYARFVERVARSRDLSTEAVDAVAGGRVWTGAQALDHGLVDALGGLHEAAAKARELAGLPADAPLRIWRGKAKPLAPQLAAEANPAAGLRYLRANLDAIFSGEAQFLLEMRNNHKF